jgi:putative SbcD/Mre11-related phosphoesterase
MEYLPDDRAVYLPSSGTLVCADLHVGRDVTSNVELRLGEHEDLTSRFEALITRYEPSEIVIAGDLLHSFDRLPTGATATVRALEGVAETGGCTITVTRGNHDTLLEELWDGPIVQEYRPDESSVLITHGDVPPEATAECYIIGHDHPTLEIEGVRRPCYLYGSDQYDGRSVLMLPSFSRLPAGVVVNEMTAAAFQSPLITNTEGLEPIVYDDDSGEIHTFPPLESLRQHL